MDKPIERAVFVRAWDLSVKTLQLTLLGGFEARVSVHGVELRSNKAKALLAYLALSRGQSRSRAELLALLWSDRSEEQARGSLRQELSVLRRALGDDAPLIIDHETVSLDSAHLATDVMVLERLANGEWDGKRPEHTLPPPGELLSGLVIRDRAFNEWLTVERSRVQALAIMAHARLLARQREAGALDTARVTATNLLALDRFSENAHRALMEAYANTGERSLALTQYEALRAELAEELGVTPEQETEALYHTIREQTGKLSPPHTEPAGTGANIVPAPSAEEPTYVRRSFARERNWFGATAAGLVVVGSAVAFLLWSEWQAREGHFAEQALALEAALEQSQLEKYHLAQRAELVTVRLKAEAEVRRHEEMTKRAELERALAKLDKELAVKQAELRALTADRRQSEIERKLELKRMQAKEAEREAKLSEQMMALEVARVRLERARLELDAARVSAEAEKQAELERLHAEETTRRAEFERDRQALVAAQQAFETERARAKTRRTEAVARIRAEEAAKREALERERDELLRQRDELLRQLAQIAPQLANTHHSAPTGVAVESTREAAVLTAWRNADATIQRAHRGKISAEIEAKHATNHAASEPMSRERVAQTGPPHEQRTAQSFELLEGAAPAAHISPATHTDRTLLEAVHGSGLGRRPHYKVALLPQGYNTSNVRVRALEDSAHDFVSNNDWLELVYSYYLPEYRGTTASMNVIDDLWIGPTEGQRPHKARVLELGERLGADIVILYRTRTVFEGLEEHAPTRAFLFDVASGESYQARGARSNNARITSDVFTSFLKYRDDLSEAYDDAGLAKVE